jgi:hypothetical protein
MRRTWWSRTCAALFAVWFTVNAVELAALHACELHEAPLASATASGAPHTHHGHDGHHALGSDAGQPGDQTSCCTCPADCNPVSPGALPIATTGPVVATTATTDTGLPDYEYVPVAAAHVLPFANGPPIRT